MRGWKARDGPVAQRVDDEEAASVGVGGALIARIGEDGARRWR